MGLKKKSKVSAEFSMSSLTDIIFLLLIFFMLTSSLVAPNALNLKMPGSSKQAAVDRNSKTDKIQISSSGKYRFNGRTHSLGELSRKLKQKSRSSSKKYNLVISPSDKAPTNSVVAVLDLGLQYNINTILSAEK